ncbi:type II toxin-antitoxin system Phd/YefM family antitoxin [Salmonella enterica]|nr:type II toxin-antitoxin system Phd/YefM family antitoxin [Salmonella enterica]
MMPRINSRKARDTWAQVLQDAEKQPQEITRTGERESLVVLSMSRYEQLLKLEQKAKQAK